MNNCFRSVPHFVGLIENEFTNALYKNNYNYALKESNNRKCKQLAFRNFNETTFELQDISILKKYIWKKYKQIKRKKCKQIKRKKLKNVSFICETLNKK